MGLELIQRVAKVTMAKVFSGKCLKKANEKWQTSQKSEKGICINNGIWDKWQKGRRQIGHGKWAAANVIAPEERLIGFRSKLTLTLAYNKG